MPRFESSFPEHQIYEDHRALHNGAGGTVAVTASGNGDAVQIPGNVRGVIGHLDFTDSGSNVLDLLDVYIQTWLPMPGCTPAGRWVDVMHFTQLTGTTATDIYEYMKVNAGQAQAAFETVAGGALAGAAIRNIIGEQWRARWVVFDGGGTHTFTFKVHLHPT